MTNKVHCPQFASLVANGLEIVDYVTNSCEEQCLIQNFDQLFQRKCFFIAIFLKDMKKKNFDV